ncbi:hypothetical protein BSY16_4521 (plasmid) [Sinorhizobium sp. RAC02]|nr:hypothetical protein BSY16_4521 [Sinorhizobium sp. RAC02]
MATLDEMFSAIYACWRPPASLGHMRVMLRFRLKRDGTLIAPPRLAWIHATGVGSDDREKFASSALDALTHALPIPFTEKMGGAIAGRTVTPYFESGRN